MEKLNFPVFKEPLPEARSLSMDEYVQFVEMYLRYFYDREVHEYWEKRQRVNVPFSLKLK